MHEKYDSKKYRKYLRLFDRFAKIAQCDFSQKLGKDRSITLIKIIRGEFEKILPKIPYIGGKKTFTDFMIFTAMYLALYRILKEEGFQVEKIGCFIWEINTSIFKALPKLPLKLFGGRIFSPSYIQNLKRRAVESQKRQYSTDYVYEFVEGDGKTYDFGVDYLECAGVKFLREQNAFELAPYLCPVDMLYSQMFGWGLTRTMTIAEGYDRCDFRFKKYSITDVALPASLQNYILRKKD